MFVLVCLHCLFVCLFVHIVCFGLFVCQQMFSQQQHSIINEKRITENNVLQYNSNNCIAFYYDNDFHTKMSSCSNLEFKKIMKGDGTGHIGLKYPPPLYLLPSLSFFYCNVILRFYLLSFLSFSFALLYFGFIFFHLLSFLFVGKFILWSYLLPS